jgi:hypothetical protein
MRRIVMVWLAGLVGCGDGRQTVHASTVRAGADKLTDAQTESAQAHLDRASAPLDLTITATGLTISFVHPKGEIVGPCDLAINPGTFTAGYKYHTGMFPATRELTLPLASFARGDDRFDPVRKKVMEVRAHCTVRPNGNVTDSTVHDQDEKMVDVMPS